MNYQNVAIIHPKINLIIAMMEITIYPNSLILALATQESGKNHFLIGFTVETLELLEEAANEHGALIEHKYFASKNQFIEFANSNELLGRNMDWVYEQMR